MSSTREHDSELVQSHLDWTSKQGRILTANGMATDFYTEQNGFPFDETELPHHHLLRNETSFSNILSSEKVDSPIMGAWSRDYFVGGWEFSSHKEEIVYNLQTNTLFVDLRIPHSRNVVLKTAATCLQDYTNEELRFYARQHVFCGTSCIAKNHNGKHPPFCCTRHHVLDWNFVGVPRPRPNKWWIEFKPLSQNTWKEWAFATDMHGQYYYVEQWQRLEGGGDDNNVSLALRKERLDDETNDEDGILVVVGSHFNYIQGHALVESEEKYKDTTSSLVALVDAALEVGDRETAIAWLGRIRAGHGRICSEKGKWKIDCAIEPWKEETLLFDNGDVVVEGTDMKDCCVIWGGERWSVFDSTIQDVQQVKNLFEKGSV